MSKSKSRKTADVFDGEMKTEDVYLITDTSSLVGLQGETQADANAYFAGADGQGDLIEGLRDDLDQEIIDREQGDQAVADALAQEVTDRTDGDDSLQAQIDALPAPTPPYDDTSLKDGLAQEVKDREQGDQALADALTQETQDREQGDLNLEADLQQEIKDREDNDTTIITNFQAGDAALQAQIDSHLSGHGSGGSGWEPPGPIDTDLGMYYWQSNNNVTYGNAGYTPLSHHNVSDASHWNLSYHNRDRVDNDMTQKLADIRDLMDAGAEFTITVSDWRGSATWPITKYTNHAFDEWTQFDIDKDEVEGDTAFLNSDVTSWPINSHELTFTFTQLILTYEEMIALEHEHHIEGDADLQKQIDANKTHSHNEYAKADHIHDGDAEYGQWRGLHSGTNHLERIAPGGVGMTAGIEISKANYIYIHREMPDGSMAAPTDREFQEMFAHPDRFFEVNDNYYYHRWVISHALLDTYNSDIVQVFFVADSHETNEGSRLWSHWIPSSGKTLNVELKFPEFATQKELDELTTTVSDMRTDLNQEVSDRTDGDTTLDTKIDDEIQDRKDGDAALQSQIDGLGSGPSQGELDKKVNKSGDTLTGKLSLKLEYPNRMWLGLAHTFPKNADGANETGGQEFGTEVDIDTGNTYKGRFRVSNRYGAPFQVTGGADPTVRIGPVNSKQDETDPDNDPNKYVPLRLSGDPKQRDDAARKAYVDDMQGRDNSWTGSNEWVSGETAHQEVRRDPDLDAGDGFTIYGHKKGGSGIDDKLLTVYHNEESNADGDAVNYFGKDSSGPNLCNVSRAQEIAEKEVQKLADTLDDTDLLPLNNRWTGENDFMKKVDLFRDTTVSVGDGFTIHGQVAGSSSATSPLFQVRHNSLSASNTDYITYAGRTSSNMDIQTKMSVEALINTAIQNISVPPPKFHAFDARINTTFIKDSSSWPIVTPQSYFKCVVNKTDSSANDWPGNAVFLNIKVSDALMHDDKTTGIGNFVIRTQTGDVMLAGMINSYEGIVTINGKQWQQFHIEKWDAAGTRWEDRGIYSLALSGSHWG